MKKHVIILFLFIISAMSCEKETDPFAIKKNSIGFLNDSTQVKDLHLAFPQDSIVNYKGDSTFQIPMNRVEIYEKGGTLLLTLTPKTMADSSSTINSILIKDERYKTQEGISILSRFSDIQNAYQISKIDNLINTFVISVNEIDAQFAIDKTELPANLRYDMNMTIEESQIPNGARIKYFFINWD